MAFKVLEFGFSLIYNRTKICFVAEFISPCSDLNRSPMRQLNDIIADCIQDESQKQNLLHSPRSCLQERGFTVPDSVTLNVYQSSAKEIHIVIPAPSCASDINTQLADNVYKRIVIQALTNPTFKYTLFDHPKEILEKYYQIELEPEVRVHAHLMDQSNWVFVIPENY